MGFDSLNSAERASLGKGSFHKLDDLLLTPTDIIARRCRISPLEAKNIVAIAAQDDLDDIKGLSTFLDEPDTCTTGDEHIDQALGGGVRTGMLWEIVGESGAGKTQLALHLSLAIQLPQRKGGLSGSCCYLTTSSKLPTARLVELVDSHPILDSSFCGLQGIHSIPSPSIPILIRILRDILPPFITQQSQIKPVKLLVIDALGELFHTTEKTTTKTLVERSRDISQISGLLHSIASTHAIAIVVLNEVVDTFDRGYIESDDRTLSYSDQARFFSRASTIPGENKKEASLGLVWANQINVRIQMSRTGRRRYIDAPDLPKRPRLQHHNVTSPNNGDDKTTLIRRMSVVFSSVAVPTSVDYVVERNGLFGLPSNDGQTRTVTVVGSRDSVDPPLATQIAPLDRGLEEEGDNDASSEWEVEP